MIRPIIGHGLCDYCGNPFPKKHEGKWYCGPSCRSGAYQYRLKNGFDARRIEELRRKGTAPRLKVGDEYIDYDY